MTSLEIAELTGKQHKHLMEAIRKMEPAWVKVHGSKFRLMFREVAIGNGAVRRDPCYQLTKTECLYIAVPKGIPEGLSRDSVYGYHREVLGGE